MGTEVSKSGSSFGQQHPILTIRKLKSFIYVQVGSCCEMFTKEQHHQLFLYKLWMNEYSRIRTFRMLLKDTKYCTLSRLYANYLQLNAWDPLLYSQLTEYRQEMS